MLDIEKVLTELDKLFSEGNPEKTEQYLLEQLQVAEAEKDDAAKITLFNEIIGFCRDMGKYEESLSYCRQVLILLQEKGYKGSISYATTLINVGNACRAAGLLQESLEYFKAVMPIYEKLLPENDFRIASLYNNMSLLYQKMGEHEEAIKACMAALHIAETYKEASIECATTRTNMAISLLEQGKLDPEKLEQAKTELTKAIALFEKQSEGDYHYSAALSAMGSYYMEKQQYQEAVSYFEKAKKEIMRHVGSTGPAFAAIDSNLQTALAATREAGTETPNTATQSNTDAPSSMKGLALCKAYYEAYGKAMLEKVCPEYVGQIAVGLVGEGSDCFGYDDGLSRDHDYGPRFCMWMNQEIYDKVGRQLESAYEALPKEFQGITKTTSSKGTFREGVMVTEEFVSHLLGVPWKLLGKPESWQLLSENGLAALQNGAIWEAGDGALLRIRTKLSFYPDAIFHQKLAQTLAMMAQYGQYNLERMHRRGDSIATALCLSGYMQETMKCIYLLNRTYPPYYKWLHEGMKGLKRLPEIGDILRALWDYKEDTQKRTGIIEVIAKLIVHEMQEQGLSSLDELFLERQADYVVKKENLIEKLVLLEWQDFDKVDNEGGRADCQDDWETFSIMRKSQYLTWTIPMLESFIQDFEAADRAGWNLIAEKYGRMMEATAPEEYDKIQSRFPVVSDKKKAIVLEIAKIQVKWMEEFSQKYPKLSQNARVIHETENTYFRTSYETYLKGELMTYSDETLALYGQFIVSISEKKENLTQMIMENTVKLYGYASLEEAEAKQE